MTKDDVLSSLWVEKYRPKNFTKMALLPAYREKMESYVKAGIIPHLLFEGPAGSGKTTCSRILIDTINCEALKMNASDERGIDVIRNKVKSFAQVATFKKFKIILLDEADNITPDAQDALKNTMEQYSSVTRFILTANHISKIRDPIQSRCQVFHFNAMPKSEMANILETILEAEKIGYEQADVDKHIELCYPDLRKAINSMQQGIRSGIFKYSDERDTYKNIIELARKKDLKEIRKILVSKKSVDYADLYRYFYDNIDQFDQGIRLSILLDAAEYLYRDLNIVDKEMNFVAFCVKLTTYIK